MAGLVVRLSFGRAFRCSHSHIHVCLQRHIRAQFGSFRFSARHASRQRLILKSALRRPKPHGAVVARAREQPAARAPADGVHAPRVARQNLEECLGVPVPNVHLWGGRGAVVSACMPTRGVPRCAGPKCTPVCPHWRSRRGTRPRRRSTRVERTDRECARGTGGSSSQSPNPTGGSPVPRPRSVPRPR